ncbi:MAG: 50S ribosomal protein L25/general stress protein Ctc [Rhodospirillales bacterium]|nr:50S ribosomal protein L25/general stress protein Ctc [Rhodospirillales bacterium]
MATNRIQLSAAKRERAGKGVARALRRENRVPAVIYGDGKPPVTISLPDKETNLEYRKGHMFTSLTDLDIDGQKALVLARDVQLHPVTERVEHVDFLRVTPKTRISVQVPVEFTNEAECQGLKDKGVLNIVHHELELLCAATDIPESVQIDMKGYEIGDAVRSSAVILPAGTELVGAQEEDFTIATIMAPRAVTEETPAAAPAAAPAADAKAAAPAAGAKAAPAAAAKK